MSSDWTCSPGTPTALTDSSHFATSPASTGLHLRSGHGWFLLYPVYFIVTQLPYHPTIQILKASINSPQIIIHVTSLQIIIHVTIPQIIIHVTSLQIIIHVTIPQIIIHVASPQIIIHVTSPQIIIHVTSPQIIIHVASPQTIIRVTCIRILPNKHSFWSLKYR
jgi:hypothetical protein